MAKFSVLYCARSRTPRAEFGDSMNHYDVSRTRSRSGTAPSIVPPLMAARWEIRKGLPVHASGSRFANLSGRRPLFGDRSGGLPNLNRSEASNGYSRLPALVRTAGLEARHG